MLMDEPFGAIDPINRERLQNEFLRLQAELRKTIVFVTHDIDEAIKMGDRIAILKEGGILAQYATPAELLMYPADAVRGGLRRLRPGAQAARAAAGARHRPLEGADRADRRAGLRGQAPSSPTPTSTIPLVVDDDGRPLGWLSERGLQGERVREDFRSPAEPVVELDDILRDALSDLLSADTQYGPVVDADGCVAGVLSMEVLSHALSVPGASTSRAPRSSQSHAERRAAEEPA